VSFEGGTIGVISGTPTYTANYYFTLKMQDSDLPPYEETRNYVIRVVEPSTYIVGDADGDGVINVSDIVYLINFVFAEGPAPEPEAAGDVDCNGTVNVSDVVVLIQYVFGEGPTPECPDSFRAPGAARAID
jgi:hypothetical protein